jgi:hypothetical protein
VSLFDRLITVRLAQVQLAMQIFDGSMLEYNLLMLLKNVAPAVQAQYNVELVISDANAALPAPTTLTVPLTSLNPDCFAGERARPPLLRDGVVRPPHSSPSSHRVQLSFAVAAPNRRQTTDDSVETTVLF